MKHLPLAIVISLTVVIALAADQPGETHRVFYLAEVDNGVGVESLTLAEGARLLGADFLSRFERIAIDFTGKRMRLWKGS